MDLVHHLIHLIFKENILGTEDFQKTDNGQNPALGKCNVPLSEPFRTEVNLHHLSYIIHAHTHHVPLCNSLTSSCL